MQGSKLCPLLFILDLNNFALRNALHSNTIYIYADDMSIKMFFKDEEELFEIMPLEINKIVDWLSHNKLNLNLPDVKIC